MLHIKHTISGNSHTVPSSWKDITLAQAIELSAVKMPEKVSDRADWYKHLEVVKRHYVILSSMSEQEIEQTNPIHLVHLFETNMLPFTRDLHAQFPSSYTPKLIDSFVHKKVRYFMPQSLVIDDETVILNYDTKAKPFVEQSNLLKIYSTMRDEGIKQMGMLVAATCKRDRNEQWDETRVIERSKAFRDLKMDVVWEVFFCLLQHMSKSMRDTRLSMQRDRDRKRQEKTKKWDGKYGCSWLRKVVSQARHSELMK